MDRKTSATLLSELDALGPVAAERETGADDYSEGRLACYRSEHFDVEKSRPWKLGWLDANLTLTDDSGE